MPAYLDDSPEEYRAMIAELIEEIEAEAAKRGDRLVVGVEAILRQDPCRHDPSTLGLQSRNRLSGEELSTGLAVHRR
jgi:hypothetical protein